MISARDELRHLADTLDEFQAGLALDMIQQRFPSWFRDDAPPRDARPRSAAESERLRRQNNDLGPIS